MQVGATDKHRLFQKGKKQILKSNRDSNRASRAGPEMAEKLPSAV